MPDIYTLPVPDQVERVRGLAEFLDHEWEMLVRSFEMLVPAAIDPDLIARFHQSEGSWGFGMIRMQLIERCVLSVYKLLADGNDTNPSLLTLVRPFLRGNRERYAELLEILRSDYSDCTRQFLRKNVEHDPIGKLQYSNRPVKVMQKRPERNLIRGPTR